MTEQPSSFLVLIAVPYLVLGAVAFTMSRDLRARPPWEWLWAFGGLFALSLWTPLGSLIPGVPDVRWMTGLMSGLAFLCLLEFARQDGGRGQMFPRWGMLAGVFILSGLLAAGVGEKPWVISLVLGIPSGVLVFAMLLAYRRDLSGWAQTWVLLLAIGLLLVPVAALVGSGLRSDALHPNAAVFAVGILAALAAVLLDLWHVNVRRGRGAVSSHLANLAVAGVCLAAVIAAGTRVAELVADTARQELLFNTRQQNLRVAMAIGQMHDMGRQMAQSMSGSPLVIRRFADSDPEAVANAHNILDRYAENFRADIAYLVNANGIVVASSNRGRPDSIVGVNLSNREHFRRAMAGEVYSLVALGAVTHTRGLYASAPVHDAAGRIIGVAMIRNDLESLERQFGTEGHTALVDPTGLVWLATERQWNYQRMWSRSRPTTPPALIPASTEAASDLVGLPDHPLRSGEMVTLGGEPCEVDRMLVGPEGWSLVSFVPVRPAFRTWATGLMATAFAIAIVLGIGGSIHLLGQYAAGQQQQQVLSSSLKEMERLMSVLSHDLRTPLAAAHSSVEYLLTLPEIQGEAREAAAMAADQQMAMADMVTRLLDAIRIRNGMMEWSWGSVDLCHVLQSVHRTVSALPALQPGVQMQLHCDTAPQSVRGDAQAISRLVTNLATNAIRHTTRGAIAISASQRQADGLHWLVIEISDTGEGIAPDVLPLLGRPFVLGGKQDGAGGSGLGLAIAAGICAAHGGKLTVRSQIGRGTTFTAWLRVDLPSPAKTLGEATIQVQRDGVP